MPVKEVSPHQQARKNLRDAAPIPEIFKFSDEGEVLYGVFRGYMETAIADDKVIKSAIVEVEDGSRLALALTTRLELHFAQEKVGNYVEVTWTGLEKIKEGRNRGKERNTYKFRSAPGDAR